MLYNFILDNFGKAEPIFLSDIKGYSNEYIRQEMKRLTDEGKLERLYNGVYYIPYKTILGTKGRISIQKFVEKKFLKSNESVIGYYTGITLLNKLGLTTQNSSVYEICSNIATTKQRKLTIDGVNMIIYKPIIEISSENYKELQFLDLMLILDKYSEIKQEELKVKLRKYVAEENLNFVLIKKYLPLYPDRVYRNLYYGGLMSELV